MELYSSEVMNAHREAVAYASAEAANYWNAVDRAVDLILSHTSTEDAIAKAAAEFEIAESDRADMLEAVHGELAAQAYYN